MLGWTFISLQILYLHLPYLMVDYILIIIMLHSVSYGHPMSRPLWQFPSFVRIQDRWMQQLSWSLTCTRWLQEKENDEHNVDEPLLT